MCSINSFIYSYRDSIDSPFPDITSNNTLEALKMMKRIKNEISSGKKTLYVFFYF